METGFGAVMGDYDVVRSLATLAAAGRRRSWAETELWAALRILASGEVPRSKLRGSWAGAMGQTQLLPTAYLTTRPSGGAGAHRDIWGSPQDALAAAADLLAKAGWRRGEGWAREVIAPAGFDLGLAEGPGQEVPHFFLSCEVDATRLDGWRATVRQRSGAPGVTHTDLLVRLVAAALQEHPRVNATWRDGAILDNEHVNIGLAVAADDGLVVPVIADADQLDLLEIAVRRAELVAAARERRLKPIDVQGGTFTISNLGMFRVDAFMAIVNAPQAAILSVGRIAQRAIVVDGAIVARPTLVLGLSFDHRVVDGAAGARFLDTLAALVEEPASLIR